MSVKSTPPCACLREVSPPTVFFSERLPFTQAPSTSTSTCTYKACRLPLFPAVEPLGGTDGSRFARLNRYLCSSQSFACDFPHILLPALLVTYLLAVLTR